MQNFLGRMGVETSLGPKNLSDETLRLCLDCKSRAISDVKKNQIQLSFVVCYATIKYKDCRGFLIQGFAFFSFFFFFGLVIFVFITFLK